MKTSSTEIGSPRPWTRPARAEGFTRWELAAVLAGLGLLLGMVFPSWANTQRASDRAWCVNNLRLVGRALHVWGKDHEDHCPWRTPVASGGTQRSGKAGAAWYEYASLSNQLVSPQFLACPSDSGRKRAWDFSTSQQGGLLNSGYRDNAVSYWVGLDAGYVAGSLASFERAPDHALGGDRNLSVNALNSGCSSGVNNAATIFARPVQSMTSAWTNDVHGLSGNVLFGDGRVLPLSTPSMRQALSRGDDNGSIHLLFP